MKRALPFVLVASVLVAPAVVRAEEPQPDGPQPIFRDFTKKYHETEESLATGSCTSACQALQSLRQAAEQICQLSPGPRCDRARVAAEEMTKKVRAQCPDCVIASLPGPDQKQPAKQPAEEPPKPAPGAGDSATTANAPSPPAAERGSRGCGCDVTTADGAFDPSWIALVLWAISRRKKKSQPQA